VPPLGPVLNAESRGFSRIERAVGAQAVLRQLVGGPTDARHGVCGIEGRLFNFSEIIFRIASQPDSADRDQRVVAM
jgi:hypothetical protein